jgi:thiaminase/transcriptional activator TenA
MAGLSQHLFALGRPNLDRQLAHPTVRGIANGDLEPARFRAWLFL